MNGIDNFNIKIISDGTVANTVIINTDTGEKIGGVQKISFEADANKAFTILKIELIVQNLEIEAKEMVIIQKHLLPLI